MPNHVHGIIWILGEGLSARQTLPRRRGVGARHASPLRAGGGAPAGSLGAIIGSFKAAAARRMNVARGTPGARVWQRNYYERVVRDEQEVQRVREYIQLNHLKWQFDKENPDRTADSAYSREWSWLEGGPLR